MKIDELPQMLRDAVTVKRVYGEPYQVDGITLIPVVRSGGAAGGGEGEAPDGGGRGIGIGFGATPIGVYAVKDGEVTFIPALDPVALATRATLVAVTLILSWRSVAKARQRRKSRGTRAPRSAPGFNLGYSNVGL